MPDLASDRNLIFSSGGKSSLHVLTATGVLSRCSVPLNTSPKLPWLTWGLGDEEWRGGEVGKAVVISYFFDFAFYSLLNNSEAEAARPWQEVRSPSQAVPPAPRLHGSESTSCPAG